MFPMEIAGAGGRSLRELWSGGAHAHLGMTVPGFPSLYVMYGPNTNTSGGSIIAYLEAQAGYIRQAIELQRDRGAPLAVRAEVEAASDREVQSASTGTAWLRCDSWYRDDSGRIVTNWPGYMREYFERDPAAGSRRLRARRLRALSARAPSPGGARTPAGTAARRRPSGRPRRAAAP